MNPPLSAPQPMTAAHRLDDFSCGEPGLGEWLKRRAMANQQSGASRTFVVVDQDDCVQGYYAMAVGAVGVDTPEQLAELRELGCQVAQGGLFSGPVTASELEQLLAADPSW